ncbi:MAG: PH domain-containing protein [Congregibacter sp.]
MVFPSKIDSWVIGLVLISAVLSVLAAGSMLRQSVNAPGLLAPLLTCVLGAGLPLWLLGSTRYIIDEECCFIRSGPFKWQFPLASVEAITSTRNPISSPALSLDRLEVRYGGGRTILVSPKDPGAFMAALLGGTDKPLSEQD